MVEPRPYPRRPSPRPVRAWLTDERFFVGRAVDVSSHDVDLARSKLAPTDTVGPREMLRICPRTRVILLTMHTEDRYVHEALRAGVSGYVVKTQATADLVRAIREVSHDMTYLSPRVSRTVVQAYLAKAEVPDPLT